MVSTHQRRRARTTSTRTTTSTTTVDVNDDLHRAQINAANDAELRANAVNIHDQIEASRPQNTTRTYDPKQREFQVRHT